MPKFQKLCPIVTILILSITLLTQIIANPTCRVFGLGGTQPDMVCMLSEFIKQFINKQERSPITNAVIFEGPTGTGKTEVTKLISQNSGVETKIVYMRLIITKHQNMQEAAEEIRKIYQEADDYVTKENKPLIIIIEEMEIIDASNHEKMHDISKAIIGEINAQIEKHQKNKGVVTIIVTNESSKLDRGLTLRCQRVIWTFPNEADRTAIMWHYLNPTFPRSFFKFHKFHMLQVLKV
ncbi:MAG TPA: AAA family ATPase [Candidatus Babeliales bacterium]|nr:AAA family ATPase [Candidatus Babeliales bacterium]